MSDLFVDNIKHQSSQGSGTITLGTSGETIALASGATNHIGINVADSWRITASTTPTDNNFVTSNWERIDGTVEGTIGTALTESSGVFSFPETGLYLVTCTGSWSAPSNTNARYLGFYPKFSNDGGSNYNIFGSISYTSISGNSGLTYASNISNTFLNVDNTSNIKMKLLAESSGSVSTLIGGSNSSATSFTVIRMGDAS